MKHIRTSMILPLVLIPVICSAAVIHVPEDYSTIQAGINAASNGDTVLVADGLYTGEGNKNISFHGKTILVSSENGAGLCAIDCENSGRGFIFSDGETHESILRGFTIKNANADSEGGGINCWNSSPKILDCILTDNWANWDGGGINCVYSSAYIANCVVSNNTAYAEPDNAYGGGICAWMSSITIANCLIHNNTAIGVYYSGTQGYGGGVFLSDTGQTMPCVMMNCTVTKNRVEEGDYGGVFCGEKTVITNCIFRDNDSGSFACFGNPTMTYTNLNMDFPGDGNIDMDPLFVMGPFGDYYLSHINAGQPLDSPCIDAGSDLAENVCFSSVSQNICLDELTTRIDQIEDTETVDMGYHYPLPLPSPTPTPECDTLGCTIHMPSDIYPGDPYFCYLSICNPTQEIYNDVPLFAVLEIYGQYYFAPSFSDFDNYFILLEPGITIFDIITEFYWPTGGSGGFSACWIAGMTNAEMTELFGEYDIACFTVH